MRCPCRIFSRAAAWRLAVLAAIALVLAAWSCFAMLRMPGQPHRGPLPPLSEAESALAARLRRHVVELADVIGPRHLGRAGTLEQSAAYITATLEEAGLHVQRQVYTVAGHPCVNLWVELAGRSEPDRCVVIGAHYDTVPGSPGADDNASGVAGTLELARHFASVRTARSIRFVLFVNEEPPYFTTDDMGSLRYARQCAEDGLDVTAMISLEMLGCYSDEPGSQRYPAPLGLLYPSRGNFIGFVGNFSSRRLVRRCIATFRAHAAFPSEGAAVPAALPGIGWSDHWSFWKAGYSAIMITDTALYRYPHYHGARDAADQLDYERMARVVEGLKPVIADLAGP